MAEARGMVDEWDPYGDSKFNRTKADLPGLGTENGRAESARSVLGKLDEKVLATAILYAIDYGQTSNIAANPNVAEEQNPVLGKHPTQGQVNKYFAAIIGTHGLLNAVLPKKYANLYNSVAASVQGNVVTKNQEHGTMIGRGTR